MHVRSGSGYSFKHLDVTYAVPTFSSRCQLIAYAVALCRQVPARTGRIAGIFALFNFFPEIPEDFSFIAHANVHLQPLLRRAADWICKYNVRNKCITIMGDDSNLHLACITERVGPSSAAMAISTLVTACNDSDQYNVSFVAYSDYIRKGCQRTYLECALGTERLSNPATSKSYAKVSLQAQTHSTKTTPSTQISQELILQRQDELTIQCLTTEDPIDLNRMSMDALAVVEDVSHEHTRFSSAHRFCCNVKAVRFLPEDNPHVQVRTLLCSCIYKNDE